MSKDMLGSLTRALVGVPQKMLGLLFDIANRLGSVDGEKFFTDLATFVREWKNVSVQFIESYTRRLFADEVLTLEALPGGDMIAGSTDLFQWGIDSDFINWGLNIPSRPTISAGVVVDKLVANATFAQMFGAQDLESRRMTQGQIMAFCRKYPEKLRTGGYATLFLFTKGDEPVNEDMSNVFFTPVRVNDGGRLGVGVSRFSDGSVWHAGLRNRIVSLQQNL